MGNTITIKHGSRVPTSSSLKPYELGYDENGKCLYIGNPNTNSAPIKISSAGDFLPLSGGTLSGVVNSSHNINLYNTNAYVSLGAASNSSKCYVQTYNPVDNGVDDDNLKAGFGFGWSNSMLIDKYGNVTIKGVQIAPVTYVSSKPASPVAGVIYAIPI